MAGGPNLYPHHRGAPRVLHGVVEGFLEDQVHVLTRKRVEDYVGQVGGDVEFAVETGGG